MKNIWILIFLGLLLFLQSDAQIKMDDLLRTNETMTISRSTHENSYMERWMDGAITKHDTTLRSSTMSQERRLGFSLLIGGSVLIGGVSINYFVTPQLNARVAISPFSISKGFSGGVNYYFIKSGINAGWSPYVGVEYGRLSSEPIVCLFGGCSADKLYSLYFPVGITWLAKKGFTVSLEGSFLYTYNLSDNEKDYVGPWFGINIGIRGLN